MLLAIDASRANNLKRTGTEWYAYYLVQELKKIIPDSHRVILYSREPLRDGLEELPQHWESRVLGWPPKFLWTQVRMSWEMWRRPPDMLFVPVHALPMILPKKVVTTIHDVAFRSLRHAYGMCERWYQHFVVWYATKRAGVLLTVSEFSKSEIRKYYKVHPEKIVVTLESCASVSSTVPTGTSSRDVLEKYGIHGRYFLFVGRIEYKKNVDGLMKAFALFQEKVGVIRDLQLMLVGKPGYGYSAIKKLLRAQKGVVELGYVAQEDMALLYAHAEAFVFPSRYEGFGMPILEAFRAGVPVIASHNTSLPEVAGDAALYCDPTKPYTIADAMARVMGNPAFRAELIQKGKNRLQLFSWEKTARETWEVLQKLGETQR